MNIVHVSATPLVGVPILVTNLMRKYLSSVSVRCVQQRNKYADGRTYDKDLLYTDAETPHVLARADVVFIHNGVHNDKVLAMIKDKRKVLICHSQPFHIEKDLFRVVNAIAVVAQYQPRLYTEHKISLVPNLIDLEDPLYTPGERRQGLWVSFAPSNTNDWDPNSVYKWDRKGVKETLAILQSSGVRYEFMTGQPLPVVLKKSRTCHITIDELVTGAYHRRSLEGAAHGTLTLNAADGETLRAIQWITGTNDVPFFICRKWESLSGILDQARRVPEWVVKEGKRARTWMNNHWQPKKLLEAYYMPLAVGEKIRLYS